MTRSEFIEQIDSWSSLIQFCYEEDMYDFVDDIFEWDNLSDWVNENLSELANNNNWSTVLDYLSDINNLSPYGYYQMYEWFCFEELNDYDDFEDMKNDVIERMDDNDRWNEEEIEELEDFVVEKAEEDEDDFEFEEEDFSLEELFENANKESFAFKEEIDKLKEEEREKEKIEAAKAEAEFNDFINGLTTAV